MFFAWKYYHELKKQLSIYSQQFDVIQENAIVEEKQEKNVRKRPSQNLSNNVKKKKCTF